MVSVLVLVVLGLCILAGYYRGVIYSALSIGITVVSFFLALLMVPVLAGGVKSNESLYGSMLYYFEGYEYINETAVELVHDPASDVSDEELAVIVENADMPLPLGRAVTRNIQNLAYAKDDIVTLGDYFNQTIVDVVINILSLLALFVLFRVLFGFILRTVDYASRGLPVLRRFDPLFSCGIGFLHGVLLLYILFLVAPILLTIDTKLGGYLVDSPIGGFFYRMNPLLWMIPTT